MYQQSAQFNRKTGRGKDFLDPKKKSLTNKFEQSYVNPIDSSQNSGPFNQKINKKINKIKVKCLLCLCQTVTGTKLVTNNNLLVGFFIDCDLIEG